MKRGEVRWYVFSRPDKERPVLILTWYPPEFLGEVTVAPITSTIRDIPSEVLLTKKQTAYREIAPSISTISRRFPKKDRLADHDAKRRQDATGACEFAIRSGFLAAR